MPRTRHRPRPLFPVAIVVLLALAACAPSGPATRRAGPPFLLLHDWYGTSPVATPSYIRDHREYLDSLPFDGIVAYLRTPDGALNVSASMLNPNELSEAQFAEVLAPLAGLRFRNLTENFAAVLGGRPPDFMDDWTAVIRNFGRLARAARETGLRGIYFDNETYYAPWSDYPKGVRHPGKPLREYQDQARRRGREVMEALTTEYAGITVIVLHGPYISEPRAPAALFPQVQSSNELHGPFFVGLCEGAGPRARVVDGGELYQLRGDSEFRESRDWRKRAFPSNEIDCGYLPAGLRETWSERVGVAFGVYDRPFRGRPMDPVVLAATLSRALRHADRYVWLYIEGPSFLKPPGEGGAPAEWVDAVRRAKP
ncbi:MAG TPA: hypothetical protein VJU16_06590 [Planctomycetota bacterium]|nr:hypothetical protein [Planctomycetota bacterium]